HGRRAVADGDEGGGTRHWRARCCCQSEGAASAPLRRAPVGPAAAFLPFYRSWAAVPCVRGGERNEGAEGRRVALPVNGRSAAAVAGRSAVSSLSTSCVPSSANLRYGRWPAAGGAVHRAGCEHRGSPCSARGSRT